MYNIIALQQLIYLYFYPDGISLYALLLQLQIIICQNVKTPKLHPVVKQRSADESFGPLFLHTGADKSFVFVKICKLI